MRVRAHGAEGGVSTSSQPRPNPAAQLAAARRRAAASSPPKPPPGAPVRGPGALLLARLPRSKPPPRELVDTPEACAAAIAWLRLEPVVGVDAEGESLGRDGRLCLLQLSAPCGRVALFDVLALGQPGVDALAAAVLSNPNVTKLLFDCRADADALWHQHRVALAGPVLDLQVLFVLHAARTGPKPDRLPGLGRAVAAVLPAQERARAASARAAGRALFAGPPPLSSALSGGGGAGAFARPDAWAVRPLPAALLEYACDVVYLHALYARLAESAPRGVLEGLSRARVEATIGREVQWPNGGGRDSRWSEVDF